MIAIVDTGPLYATADEDEADQLQIHSMSCLEWICS